jgi:diguanylate cyclase
VASPPVGRRTSRSPVARSAHAKLAATVANDAASSALGLVFQAVGIALIAMLSLFLRRTIPRTYLGYWAGAWSWLAFALLALFASFRVPAGRALLETFYYLGEYLFGLLLWAGCRNFATNERVQVEDVHKLLPAALLAVVLPYVPGTFTVRFVVQAAALAGLFAAALFQIHRVPGPVGPGLRVTRTALLLLTLCFAHYVPVYAWSLAARVDLAVTYRTYSSILDLILEVLLAFGMVILTMEDVHGQLENANRDLREAKERLEKLVRVDPLTESLSRHALYSLVGESRREQGVVPEGCVGVADIDNLKPLNDSYGHASGDEAIRAVARAIRSVVRADDLVFRWGGDEFLVVLFGVPEDETTRRLAALNGMLTGLKVQGGAASVDVMVSFGVAPFNGSVPLERAIETADTRMYRAKQARKSAAAGEGPASGRLAP